jgi:hypothetical protein
VARVCECVRSIVGSVGVTVLVPESAVASVGVVTFGVSVVVAAVAVGRCWSQCRLLPTRVAGRSLQG